MEESLDRALSGLLGGKVVTEEPRPAAAEKTQDIHTLAGSALEHYNKAMDHLRQGKWAQYGKELQDLEEVLEKMSRITSEKK